MFEQCELMLSELVTVLGYTVSILYWYLWSCRFFLWIWESQWNLDAQINDYHDSYPQDGWLSTSISCWKRIWYVLLLMEAILHRLIDSSSPLFTGFLPSTVWFLGNSQLRRLLPPWSIDRTLSMAIQNGLLRPVAKYCPYMFHVFESHWYELIGYILSQIKCAYTFYRYDMYTVFIYKIIFIYIYIYHTI